MNVFNVLLSNPMTRKVAPPFVPASQPVSFALTSHDFYKLQQHVGAKEIKKKITE